jgi:hypothetical protein
MTTENPAPDGGWETVRARYELREEKVTDIAASIGLTAHQLMMKAKAFGWTLRRTLESKQLLSLKGEKRKDTIQRLKALLEDRITSLETEINDIKDKTNQLKQERHYRAIGTLVRTLDKVLQIERNSTSANDDARNRFKPFTDRERHALADKLERLHRQWSAEEAQQKGDGARSSGDE